MRVTVEIREEAFPEPEPMLYDLLLLGPNVGEDADFERRPQPARELPSWDTCPSS